MSDKYQKWGLFFVLMLFFVEISAQGKSQAYINYINTYYNIAVLQQKEHAIPASIILAQGLLESGAGLGELARKSNNHFGIKCHNWEGDKAYHDDDDKGECFRKYARVLDSYEDHSAFLKNRSRYAFLFQLSATDYEAWAHGLKKAGYATDPAYAYKLISLIEKYNLHSYDLATAEKVLVADNIVENPIGTVAAYRTHKVYKNNSIKFVVSELGDTYALLAEELNIRESRLRAYNELNELSVLNPGTQLYLSYKKKRASRSNSHHVVRPGESMYSIAQAYGVKTAKLYEMNEMPYDRAASLGLVLKLR